MRLRTLFILAIASYCAYAYMTTTPDWVVPSKPESEWSQELEYQHNRLRSGPSAAQFISDKGYDPSTMME